MNNNSQLSNDASSILPPEILAELKKYNGHRDGVLCLECGYTGKMGVKKDGLKPFSAAFFTLMICAWSFTTGYFSLTGLAALFGFTWVFIMQITAAPVLSCPHCHAELDIQGKLKK